MLLDEIKAAALAATKARDVVARDVLRLAASEVAAAQEKADKPFTDAEAETVVRKLIKANEETMAASGADDPRSATLAQEIAVLKALLPKMLSVEEIVAALETVRESLLAAKADGQATGAAMKHLKSTGARVDGNDVALAVKKIRS
jgi:uncharacterized protein YqeY